MPRRNASNFSPSPEWARAFSSQLTEETVHRARRYAYDRRDMIERLGQHVDGDYVEELVQAAIGDTVQGVVVWKPEACPLVTHLRGVIRSRTWKKVIRGRKYRHFSIDERDDEGAVDEKPTEIEASLAAVRQGLGDEEALALSDLVDRIAAELRRLAAGDQVVEQLVQAFADRIEERNEVLKRTGMSEQDYHNGRRRFAYLFRQLPEELRARVQEVVSR